MDSHDHFQYNRDEAMINQAGEYALRAIVHISRITPNTPCSASEIALATKVPQAYLQKILRTLTQSNLLIAQRGMGGGFMLAKLPSAISVLDVLKACDAGPSRIERCPLGIVGHTQLCSLHKLIDQQTASVESVFSSTSIADLINDPSGFHPLCESTDGKSKPIQLGIPKNNQDD
jgi:Rrf2 family transcriptional regulator, nitric oxide-sensitive transcriptional repressor